MNRNEKKPFTEVMRKIIASKHKHSSNDNEQKQKAAEKIRWTKRDKKILLTALKKYGNENITAISQMLPDISEKEIKRKIALYSALTEHLYNDTLINDWLSSGMCKQTTLGDALLFMSLFEKHPSPLSVEGIDFGHIYKIIFQMCMNEVEPGKLLLTKEMGLIIKLLMEINETVWPRSMNELFDYLSQHYKKRVISKTYKRKKDVFPKL